MLVEGQDELKHILEGSLEEWRIFLHPYQRKLVRWETKGAMNITGAAGTGKTVALMHRAVHLAGRLSDPKSRILLTTESSTGGLPSESRNFEEADPIPTPTLFVSRRSREPGEFRKRQNWPGPDEGPIDQATFVPPPPAEMQTA